MHELAALRFAISQWKFFAFSVLSPAAAGHSLPRRKQMQMHVFDSIPKSDKYALAFSGFNGRYERVGTGAPPPHAPAEMWVTRWYEGRSGREQWRNGIGKSQHITSVYLQKLLFVIDGLTSLTSKLPKKCVR